MAEWGQIPRLVTLLESPATPKLRKLHILSALSEIHAPEALSHVTGLLKDPDLVQESIIALGGLGGESIPLLIDLFESSNMAIIQAAAAKGLGNVAALSGDYRVIPPLHHYLRQTLKTFKTAQDINFLVLTEVVWALGKLPDKGTVQPMDELQSKIWLLYDTSPEMSSLREAVNWSYKQVAEAAVTVQ
jgi:HEAT repeat protein